MLNANIPSFKALVRKSYFTKNHKDSDEFYNVHVFGIQSCAGVILRDKNYIWATYLFTIDWQNNPDSV